MPEKEGITPEPEVQPKDDPTIEEQLEAANKETAKLKEDLELTKRGLSTATSTIQKRTVALNKQEAITRRLDTLGETVEILAGVIATGQGQTRDELNTDVANRGADFKAQIQAVKQKADREARVEQSQAIVKGYQDRVEALGLTPKDEEYAGVYNLIRTGYNDPITREILDAKLDRLEAKKQTANPSGETEDARIARLVDEKYRAKLEADGSLIPESGTPSAVKGGRTYTESQIADRAFYEENKEDILKAQVEGRIVLNK